MFAEFSSSRKMGNPCPSSTFSELLKQAQVAFSNLEESVYKLWLSPYYFSFEQKADVVLIKENRAKAFQTAGNDQNLCLIEPFLSRTVPSQISFKINQANSSFSVGVCLNSVVKALQYQWKGTVQITVGNTN